MSIISPSTEDVILKSIFPDGVTGKVNSPLPEKCETISLPGLCCSLFSVFYPIREEHEGLDFVRIQLFRGKRYPLFQKLRQELSKELNIRNFEKVSHLGAYPKDFSNYEYNMYVVDCEAFANKPVHWINKKSGIHPIKNNLASFIGLLVQYIDRDLPLNKFAEACLRCFYAGGIPCGWLGDFPDGSIVCYWPHDEEPTFGDDIELPWHKCMSLREGSYPYNFPKNIVKG